MKARKKLWLYVLFFVVMIVGGCHPYNVTDTPPVSPSPSSPVANHPPITNKGNILFVGNSLTYSNNLPALISKFALKRGILLTTKSIALPNTAISDHWESGDVHKAMEKEFFDFVVIQQGPSSQADGRNMLIGYGGRYKELCVRHGSQLAFFMVWPARANYSNFEGVIENYSDAARINESLLCPVGKEWKEYMDMTNDFSFYGADQFHPSQKGSEVAASIILTTLYP